MENISNCPKCNDIFVQSQFRDVCQKCWKQEEADFETVFKFMRRRENRAATIEQVCTQTGVEEELIYKFIKKGRLQTVQFPNLGYPCDKCGHIIRTGKLCGKCQDELRKAINDHDKEEARKQELARRERATYFTLKGR